MSLINLYSIESTSAIQLASTMSVDTLYCRPNVFTVSGFINTLTFAAVASLYLKPLLYSL